MLAIKRINPVLRAVLVIGVVMAFVTSITYAALQSQATLTNTTISSGTADLKLWDGDSFESSAPGFTITDLVPGAGSAPQAFYFKNGSVPLNITANVPSLPSYDGITSWTDVEVDINCPNVGVISTNLALLNAGQVAIGTLPANSQGDSGTPGTTGNCTAVFDLNPAGLTGSSASIGAFNIVFTGTQS